MDIFNEYLQLKEEKKKKKEEDNIEKETPEDDVEKVELDVHKDDNSDVIDTDAEESTDKKDKENVEDDTDADKVVLLSPKKHKHEKPQRVVFLTNNIHTKSATIDKFKELCDKKKIKYYIADCRVAYISEKNEELYIHNHDDEKGFLIKREDTVILARRGVSQSSYSKNLLSVLERENFFCVNTLESIKLCDDKFLTYQKLINMEIDMPKTAILSNIEHLDLALRNIGEKFPVVVKLLNGTQGIGVFICDSYTSLKSTLEAIWQIKEDTDIIIQEKINSEYDIRIHVLVKGNIYSGYDDDKDAEIIAAMKRIKIEKDFRTNYSLGGTTDKIKLSKEIEELAITVAKMSGCTWCGVDIMVDEKSKKPYVIEINASPGTEGIEKTTGISVTSKILEFIMNKENWCYPALQIGFFEVLDIENVGEVITKFDTGNDTKACTLHCDEYTIKNNMVHWKVGNKTFKNKLNGYLRVQKNYKSDDGETHYERPIINLDITFNDVYFEKYSIALTNRSGKSTPFLVNRNFMKEAGLVINPEKYFMVSYLEDEIEFDEIKKDIHKGFLTKGK